MLATKATGSANAVLDIALDCYLKVRSCMFYEAIFVINQPCLHMKG